MRFNSMVSALALAVLLGGLLVGCGGGGSANAERAVIQGKVLDATDAPIAGASVNLAGTNAVTGSDGRFEISLPSSGTSTLVLVRKAGYSTTAKAVPIRQGITTQINLKLLADQIAASFPAANGITVTPNGATVTIPANGIQTAGGASYTGTVHLAASYRSATTLEGLQSFAEPYASADNSLLQSVGVAEVKLTDGAGNPLQLKTGSIATLAFPANSVSGGTATIPMWYYDETRLTWVREGEASKQADGSYQGQVSHFTLWNVDFPYVDNTRVNGCFVDRQGQPVAHVFAQIWSTGFAVNGNSDVQGKFEARVISGVPLELKAWLPFPPFAPVAISALSPGEVRTLPCVVIQDVVASGPWVMPSITTTFTVTTPAPGTTTAAYAGKYMGTYSGTESGSFDVDVAANGQVTGSVYSTVYPTLSPFTVAGTVAPGGAVSLSATAGTAGSASFTGSINATGAVSGTWVYLAPMSGSGSFVGQRQR
jgi:hypothetical protein